MSNSTKGKTMNNMKATRKISTNKLATCTHCGTTRRVNVLTRQWHNKTGVLIRERVKVNGLNRFDTAHKAALQCCGHTLSFASIKGKITSHACADKCQSATGATCSCSCGGENHGRNHA